MENKVLEALRNNSSSKYDLEIAIIALGGQYDPVRRTWTYYGPNNQWREIPTDALRDIGRAIRESAR